MSTRKLAASHEPVAASSALSYPSRRRFLIGRRHDCGRGLPANSSDSQGFRPGQHFSLFRSEQRRSLHEFDYD